MHWQYCFKYLVKMSIYNATRQELDPLAANIELHLKNVEFATSAFEPFPQAGSFEMMYSGGPLDLYSFNTVHMSIQNIINTVALELVEDRGLAIAHDATREEKRKAIYRNMIRARVQSIKTGQSNKHWFFLSPVSYNQIVELSFKILWPTSFGQSVPVVSRTLFRNSHLYPSTLYL